jgi:serine/threonine protein kinase
MQIRCPHCHVPSESTDDASWSQMVCPSCGSSFSLAGADATCTYRPGATILGHFELLEPVGTGKFGTVWKARDSKLQRTVAIKIPRQRDLDARQTEAFGHAVNDSAVGSAFSKSPSYRAANEWTGT